MRAGSGRVVEALRGLVSGFTSQLWGLCSCRRLSEASSGAAAGGRAKEWVWVPQRGPALIRGRWPRGVRLHAESLVQT